MEHEIDLTPRHLIEWLRADLARGAGTRLMVRATREFQADPAPLAGTGLDAEDEIAALTTVGLLEVTPRDGAGRWMLRLRVEDPLGSHLPEEGSVPDGPEEIGLEDVTKALVAVDSFALNTTTSGDVAELEGFLAVR